MDETPQAPTPPTPPIAPQPPVNTPNPAPTPSSNKGLIIGLVVGGVVLLLVVVGIILAIVLSNKGSDTSKNSDTQKTSDQEDQPETSDDSLREANGETAKYLSNFDAVCENGSIANAATFTKPYKVVAFSKNSTSRSFSQVTLAYKATYAADYKKFEDVNVVACLDEKAGSAVKSKTCDFKSDGKTISLDYYAVKYTLTLREAKTGKLIKTLADINGPATSCPFFVTYDKSNPKYYARPDSDAVDAALKAFAAE
ncbi:MAG TPA: hypothetical protein VGE34_00610 [Candidatus Saccharimonadales bacterium]